MGDDVVDLALAAAAVLAAVWAFGPSLMCLLGIRWLRIDVIDDPARAEPDGRDADYERRFQQFVALGFRPVGMTVETCWFIHPFKWHWRSLQGQRQLAGPDGQTFASFHRLVLDEPLRFGVVTLLSEGGLVRTTCPGASLKTDPDLRFRRVELQNVEPNELVARHQEHVTAFCQERGLTVQEGTLRELAAVEVASEHKALRRIDHRASYTTIAFFFGAPALLAYGVLRQVAWVGSTLRVGSVATCAGAAGLAAFLYLMLPGLRRQAAVQSHAPRVAQPGLGARGASVEDQEAAYQRSIAEQARARAASSRITTFVVSAILFAGSMLAFSSWGWLAWLAPVLLFHELGHWTAMRLLGHTDASIFFIPFFGAATTSDRPFEKTWHEIVVLLAGPVPGILVGIFVLQLPHSSFWSYFVAASAVLLPINVLNLMPFYPLDGGRILHALVTVGRPRLDSWLRVSGAVAFLVGAWALSSPLLVVLGVIGFWDAHRGKRLAALETRIRTAPDFTPDLPATERRMFIFRALTEERQSEPPDKRLAAVKRLERSIGLAPLPPLRALTWGVFYGAVLLGSSLFVGRILSIPKLVERCPERKTAVAVACSQLPASASIDWGRLPGDTVKRNPFKLFSREPELPVAAFVWCSTADAAAASVLRRSLDLAAVGAAYCTALPWEPPAAPDEEERGDRARRTLRVVERLYGGRAREALERRGLSIEDAVAKQMGDPPDQEILRLYRRIEERAPLSDPDAEASLARRLGRSPTGSCKHLVISNVRLPDPGDETTVAFTVGMSSADDFLPLASHLCRAGCAPEVLPFGAADPRLRLCSR